MKKLRIALAAANVALLLAVGGMVADVQFRYINKLVDWSAPPASIQKDENRVALILGASVNPNGTPSDALQDRIKEGVWLYQNGWANKVMVTGDDGAYHADEIDVMKKSVLELGVPGPDVLSDGKGYRTYESCKNAKEKGFNDVIIVTQRFHMGRALYLCNQLGINAYGSASDYQTYRRIAFFWTRDLVASVKAWIDLHIWKPAPPVKI